MFFFPSEFDFFLAHLALLSPNVLLAKMLWVWVLPPSTFLKLGLFQMRYGGISKSMCCVHLLVGPAL